MLQDSESCDFSLVILQTWTACQCPCYKKKKKKTQVLEVPNVHIIDLILFLLFLFLQFHSFFSVFFVSFLVYSLQFALNCLLGSFSRVLVL